MKRKLTILSLVMIVFFCFSFFYTFADTKKEIENQINDINSQIKALDKEIAKYQDAITKTSAEKESLAKVIKELTLTRDKLLKERAQVEKKIGAASLVIDELTNNIGDKEESIRTSEKSLSEMINALYKKDKNTLLEIMLSKNGLWEASREYYDILEINNSVKEHKEELVNKKVDLINSKIEKLNEQEKLKNLKQTLRAQESAILSTKKEKDNLLNQTKNKEAEYQKLLKEAEKRKDVFEKEMEDYEAQLKLLINPSFLPKKGSEVLAWPLDSILITSKYGIRINPFNSSISTFHYGIDFRSSTGTPVKSMATGVVIDTGNTDLSCKGASFGKWVLIKYNNGLSSTYGHLSAISVEKGQKIKTGDIVGLSGGVKGVFGSGSSTGPHLHISVYASDGVAVESFESQSCPGKILTQPRLTKSNAHLDPLFYLPKTNSKMFK
ncbi:TPA: hypothetical protein DIC38_02865 [Candidatus Nomurabacteria bacterium]|nr:MAG: peptidase, M23/M37 family [Parcubacteria bacterium RAAC4_OD1_1]HCY26595.1 hypothetical protein [Candidatus Nomurabacteria bacterium]